MDRAIEKFYEKRERKKDALRKANQKSFMEKIKPYMEISVLIITVICIGASIYYYFKFSH